MENQNHGHFLKGIMVGSFLGAAAGILFAPKSGKELRLGIKEKADNAREETKRAYSDTRTKVKDVFATVTGKRELASLRDIESPEEMAAEA